MGTDSSSQQSNRRGFSLVESAIVLAIVGLVIGGIWVASAAIYENYKVNKTVETMISLSDCINRKFPNYPSADIAANGWQQYARAIFNAGCYPKGFYLQYPTAPPNQNGHALVVGQDGEIYQVYAIAEWDLVVFPNIRVSYKNVSMCSKIAFNTIKALGNKIPSYIINNLIYSQDFRTVSYETIKSRCETQQSIPYFGLVQKPRY